MSQVIGGVDLRLGNRTEGKHRRVPSEEALLKMAAQQNTPIPFPAAFSPIPEDYETTVQQLQQQQQQQQHQQQQRAPSKLSGATTFAERINGFFAGIIRTDEPSNSPSPTGHQQEQQPFEQLGGAVPLFESTGSPADHNVTATANAGGLGATAGGFGVAGGGFGLNAAAAAGEVSGNELVEEEQQGSPKSDPSLQRVASGASASTSGEGEGLSQSRSGLGEGLSQSRSGLSFRVRARAEAIGVYGERYNVPQSAFQHPCMSAVYRLETCCDGPPAVDA